METILRLCLKDPIVIITRGAGAAGISAAFEGLNHNIPVQLFGRQESHRAELEGAGITYYVLPEATQQVDFIKQYLTEATLVITAARTAGKKAPLLIAENSLKYLPSHAVVIDLAASNGGNVARTHCEQTIFIENDIMIRNVSGYPKAEPRASSEAYGESLLIEMMSPNGDISFDNKLVQEIWVTHDGQLHEALYNDFDELAGEVSED